MRGFPSIESGRVREHLEAVLRNPYVFEYGGREDIYSAPAEEIEHAFKKAPAAWKTAIAQATIDSLADALRQQYQPFETFHAALQDSSVAGMPRDPERFATFLNDRSYDLALMTLSMVWEPGRPLTEDEAQALRNLKTEMKTQPFKYECTSPAFKDEFFELYRTMLRDTHARKQYAKQFSLLLNLLSFIELAGNPRNDLCEAASVLVPAVEEKRHIEFTDLHKNHALYGSVYRQAIAALGQLQAKEAVRVWAQILQEDVDLNPMQNATDYYLRSFRKPQRRGEANRILGTLKERFEAGVPVMGPRSIDRHNYFHREQEMTPAETLSYLGRSIASGLEGFDAVTTIVDADAFVLRIEPDGKPAYLVAPEQKKKN